MRRYETIFIIDPDLSDDRLSTINKKLIKLIKEHSGLLIEIDDWGTKRLAYEIKKKVRGHYVRLDFCSNTGIIKEIEHFFKINDNILKFMTVVLDKNADIKNIKRLLEETDNKENLNSKSEDDSKNEDSLKTETIVEKEV